MEFTYTCRKLHCSAPDRVLRKKVMYILANLTKRRARATIVAEENN
jgi:hypothetical protein